MASELSQLIESELRKAEGANKPDEHQRRLTSLRVKTGLEQAPPTLFQRVCTTKRQIIAAGAVTTLLLILIIYAAASHRHHAASPDSTPRLQSVLAPDTSSNTTVVGASNGNLHAPSEPHTRADSTTATPNTTAAPATDDLSTKAVPAIPERKRPVSEIAPTQAMAPAPSQNTAPSQDVYESAPALGPTGAEAPSESTAAVPAPSPIDAR